MPAIKVQYQKVLYEDPKTEMFEWLYRPYVDIRLKYQSKMALYPTKCIIDSGADRNLFPAERGELLGIDIAKGIPVEHQGIGGRVLKAYTHKLSMFVGTFSFDTEIDFSYAHKIPLLGRYGFFKYFKKITFNEEDRLVELVY